MMKLGELLVQHGVITRAQLKKGLQAQRIYGGKLGTNLVELGFLRDEDLAAFLSRQLSIQAAEAREFENISKEVIDMVPRETAAKHKLIPLSLDGNKLRIAVSDPADLQVIDELGFKLGKAVQPVIAPEIWVIAALERFYGVQREMRYIPVPKGDDGFVGEITNNLSDMLDVTGIGMGSLDEDEEDEAVPMEKFADEILSADSPEQVFQSMFRFLSPFFPRMALYAIKRGVIQGTLVSGFPLRSRDFMECRASMSGNSSIAAVADSGRPFRGTIPATPDNDKLFGILNIPPSVQVGLYPIPFRGRTIAVLLGVPSEGAGPPVPEAGQLVYEALSRTGMAFEILFLKKQIKSMPAVPNRGKR